jgi:uncharacterized protein
MMMIFFVVGSWEARAQQPQLQRADSAIVDGKAFVDLLVSKDFAKGFSLLDSTMQGLFADPKLKEMWAEVIGKAGAFDKQLGARTQKYMMYDVVFVTCAFERDTLDVRVVLNPMGKVSGLYFAKGKTGLAYKEPPYVDRKSFRETEVMVGSGTWALRGTLSLPLDATSSPAIVLVQGSGPNDRDETIGPNKPFRDLAWGLASKGIAVLRYEKRTKEHAAQMAAIKQTLTVNEETIDDAIAAVALLRKMQGIDTNKIFVLGHSLGGMLAPRIGLRDSHIAGFVILAGATRPLQDLIVEQSSYILSLSNTPFEKQQDQIAVLESHRIQINNLKKSDTSSTDTYFAAPATYWLDLRDYKPAQVAKKLKMPMLILQGARDYQVTMKDFGGWQDALRGRKDVSFKVYPKLNHLFMAGEGKSVPAEYEMVGHVDPDVVENIATWMKK